MVAGFRNAADFEPIIGWELYQVTLDKWHVMFFFQNGAQLLNVAYAFSHRSHDGSVDYTFEIYGPRQELSLNRVLRQRVVAVTVPSSDRLVLRFENEDEVTIHDSPDMQSWWFMPVNSTGDTASWELSDDYD